MSRVTVSMPDPLEDKLKKYAKSERESVSKIAAEAIDHYLNVMKRRKLGKKVLDLVGKAKVSPNTIKELEAGRIDCDSRI
ncbi:MAG: ribbon-helix-helix protein, CopG family [Candidatus Aminicenantes bacterium]|nr:ribbon-helix-helix protein, CopG family [Candidatus Aminicenantes bacterium]